MKKLSEVCKIVGVTRRTLQEYEKIGLLLPTSKTPSGYWLYDDNAIDKLMTIQIFVECGYKRRDIKNILESPTTDVSKEIEDLIKNLEKKRKRIDGMLNVIKSIKYVSELPIGTLRVVSNIGALSICKEKNFLDLLREFRDLTIEDIGSANLEFEDFLPIPYNIISVGFMTGIPADSNKVQEAVERTFQCFMNIVDKCAEEENYFEEITKSVIADFFEKFIMSFLNEPEFHQSIEQQCGDGAVSFIIDAIHIYIKCCKNGG